MLAATQAQAARCTDMIDTSSPVLPKGFALNKGGTIDSVGAVPAGKHLLP